MKKSILKILFVGVLSSTFLFSCSTSNNVQGTTRPLEKEKFSVLGKWELSYIGSTNGKSLAENYPQGLPYLNFSSNTQLNAFDGCNVANGKVDVTTNELTFGNLATTMKACQGVNDAAFHTYIKDKVKYSVNKDELMILKNNVPVMKFNRVAALNGTWVLEEFITKDRSAKTVAMRFPNKTPMLTFANGNLTGNDGCNNLSGNYTVNSNVLSIGNIASTRMMCEGVESGTFGERLSKVNRFEMQNGKLVLFVDGVKTMVMGNVRQPR